MAKKRSSLTITVFAGYFLLASLMGLAVWYTYNQVMEYNMMTTRSNNGNEKLLLLGEATTKLYEAESLSRQLVQNANLEGLDEYTAQIDSIKNTLAVIQNYQNNAYLDREIDSINYLLSQKSTNLKELLELRSRGETDSYYSRVLNELKKVDETFEEPNYEQRFKDLEPHQRRIIVRLLEYAKVENPEPTNLTVDSLVNSVKRVLTELESQERSYRNQLTRQENQLLKNEVELNNRLRILLSTIEAEERQASLAQVAVWQETIGKTSRIIGLLGAASLVVIFSFIFLVVRDISKSQQYRKELEGAKTYAESLLKSREQFMNTVTHDLRSPLNSVVGYTGLLEKTGLNKSQHRYLVQLKKSSDYLLHLVNDLLDLSKLEAGKMSVDQLAFNPKQLIEETVDNAVPPEKPDAVSIIVEVSDDLDRPVITDPFRIKQILTNLVSNACKFTKEGSVEVRAWLDQENNEPLLKIEIRDTGIGISKEQKEKVFEEFSQEDSSIEKRFGGSGLGLAISKKLTHLLQGEISLESEPGLGSTFLLRIPITFSQNYLEPSKEDYILADPQQYAVLVVDDEPAQLGLLKEFIKSTGMSCQTAKNGREAIESLKKKPVDLVLTDIQMPEMNGLELLKEMETTFGSSKPPVIALSGQPNISAEDYLKKGFSGSLLKPYSSQKLLTLIGEILKVDLKKRRDAPVVPADKNSGYSLSEIKSFAGEDNDALAAILKAFIDSTRANVAALETAFKNEDWEKTSGVAHKMLPMFRQLKTEPLVAQLEVLEASTSGEVEKVDLTSFLEKVNQLLDRLEQEITV